MRCREIENKFTTATSLNEVKDILTDTFGLCFVRGGGMDAFFTLPGEDSFFRLREYEHKTVELTVKRKDQNTIQNRHERNLIVPGKFIDMVSFYEDVFTTPAKFLYKNYINFYLGDAVVTAYRVSKPGGVDFPTTIIEIEAPSAELLTTFTSTVLNTTLVLTPCGVSLHNMLTTGVFDELK